MRQAGIRKTRQVQLSVKAREIQEEREVMAAYGSTDSGASLGDILGAALDKAKKKSQAAEDVADEAPAKKKTSKKAEAADAETAEEKPKKKTTKKAAKTEDDTSEA